MAEKAVRKAVGRGLRCVTLRLANVYGPFSGPFTIRPLSHLQSGTPTLVGDGLHDSNTVYVDNVIAAIKLALQAPDSVCDGQPINIADGDGLTWAQFYGIYADATSSQPVSFAFDEYLRLKREADAGGFRSRLRFHRNAWKELLLSPEAVGFGTRWLNSDPIGRFPKFILHRTPGLRAFIRRVRGSDRGPVFRIDERPVVMPPLGLLDLYAWRGSIKIDRARKMLGYEPPVSRERAMALTVEWSRSARLFQAGPGART
jgi:nucleoside-diphosphate-sugar epimerase